MGEDFSLAPNPVLEVTYLDLQRLQGQSVTLQLFNQYGQAIYQKTIEKVEQPTEKIDVAAFENGLYLLQIKPKGRRGVHKKLVVNRLY